ncbi:MAG: amidohydrolase family protein [Chloroflexi bacterium]|nr:amidohydrolase family protein [Chloroflexota bacterium]
MKTRITGRFVAGYDAAHNGGDHVVYCDGEVVYDDDRVVFVGHGYPGDVDREIAAGDALVSPGFLDMNALADIDHGILDTWPTADLMTGHVWSEDYFNHRRHELFGADDERFNRRYALTQLLLNGITTALPIAAETYREWCETEDQIADMAEIAGDLGLRLYVGQAYRGGINIIRADGSRDVAWDEACGEQGLEQAASIVRRFDGAYNGRIRGAFLPCRIETVTLDILRKTKQYADELGVPIKLHAAQGLPELALIQQWHGKRSIELLGEIGFLGPNVGIPHVFFIGGRNGVPDDGADELALLRDTGTTVIHCPIPAARHARSLDTFDGYREAGVNVALGTDMFPPDIIRAMDYASNMAKQRVRDQSAGSAADMFRAATLGGAKLLGRDDLGRLAPGSKADITIVDLSQLRTGPIDDPIRTMVMNANGAQVKTVIVDGVTVVEDGQIPGQDVEAMRARAQRYFETYKAAYSERDYLRRPTDVLFPPSFKTVERGPA